MAKVKGKVRANRPFFFIDTNGKRLEFAAGEVAEGDLEGHHLKQYELQVKTGAIEDLPVSEDQVAEEPKKAPQEPAKGKQQQKPKSKG